MQKELYSVFDLRNSPFVVEVQFSSAYIWFYIVFVLVFSLLLLRLLGQHRHNDGNVYAFFDYLKAEKSCEFNFGLGKFIRSFRCNSEVQENLRASELRLHSLAQELQKRASKRSKVADTFLLDPLLREHRRTINYHVCG